MTLSKLLKSSIVLFSMLFVGVVQAAPMSAEIPYYGEEFYQDLGAGASNDALINRIKTVLRSYHMEQSGALDKVVAKCEGSGPCRSHQPIGYNAARVWLMGGFYLQQVGTNYQVFDVYCDAYKSSSEFSSNPPAPNKIPDNNVINVEHTWPQSRFNHKFPDDLQKSDLHHLFPTDSKLNAIRGNNWFGEVTKDSQQLKCGLARTGTGTFVGQQIFEPPANHKGHVARAMFYFALRYDLHMPAEEQAVLKKWNHEHPVDELEAKRNDAVYKAQGDRNPFVDYPELADSIATF